MKYEIFTHKTNNANDIYITIHLRMFDIIHIDKKQNYRKNLITNFANVQYQIQKIITKNIQNDFEKDFQYRNAFIIYIFTIK